MVLSILVYQLFMVVESHDSIEGGIYETTETPLGKNVASWFSAG